MAFAKSILFSVLSLFVIGSLLPVPNVQAQTTFGDCSNEFTNYLTCYTTTGLDSCVSCDAGPATEPDQSLYNDPEAWCTFQIESACPVITCCEVCQDELSAYYQCFFDLIYASNPLLSSCNFDCSGYSGGGGGSDPVVNVTDDTIAGGDDDGGLDDDTVTTCLSQIVNYTACFLNSTVNCDACDVTDLQLGMGFDVNQTESTDVCAFQNSYFCPYISCCSACVEEVQAYYNCILSIESNVTAPACSIDCSDFNVTTGNGTSLGDWLNSTLGGITNGTLDSIFNGTDGSGGFGNITLDNIFNNTLGSLFNGTDYFKCYNTSLALGNCYDQNENACQGCDDVEENGSAQQFLENGDLCKYQEEALCPFIKCCARCEAELEAYYNCLFNFYDNTTATGRQADNCNIDCGGSSTPDQDTGSDGSSTPDEDAGGNTNDDTSTNNGNNTNTGSSAYSLQGYLALFSMCASAVLSIMYLY